MRGAILSGLGVGWIPEALIYDKLESGAVKQLLPHYAMQPLEVHALYSSARHLPAKVRVFLDFLQEAFPLIPGFTAK